MQLISYNGPKSAINVARDLTEDEVREKEKYTPVIAEAQSRFNLFQILGHNFSEWNSYLDSLLDPSRKPTGDEMLQLDRLLLNYLTCAYTIQEHFKVSFRRRFRKDVRKQKEYADFVE